LFGTLLKEQIVSSVFRSKTRYVLYFPTLVFVVALRQSNCADFYTIFLLIFHSVLHVNWPLIIYD